MARQTGLDDRTLHSPVTDLSVSADYKRFLAKQAIWKECLHGEDVNSINQQVSSMIWDAGVYRIVNEGRRHAPKNERGEPRQNWMIHRMIDDCFFQSQMAAIRRQVDTYGLEGPKGTYSLHSLLKDMESNMSLLTRGNYFTAENRKWDTRAVHEKQVEWMFSRRDQRGATEVPEEVYYEPHEDRHRILDVLCGVSPDQRSARDSVQVHVLTRLQERVASACQPFKDYVDQHIAHCASIESRKSRESRKSLEQHRKLTLGHLWEAHKTICQVMNFVSTHLLTGAVNYYPVAHAWAKFEYLDEPVIPSTCVSWVEDQWNEYCDEMDNASKLSVDELLKENESDNESTGDADSVVPSRCHSQSK